MNFGEHKSHCQIVSRVLKKASDMEASRDGVHLEIVLRHLWPVMDVIVASNSQTCTHKSQPLSKASPLPKASILVEASDSHI